MNTLKLDKNNVCRCRRCEGNRKPPEPMPVAGKVWLSLFIPAVIVIGAYYTIAELF